MTSAPGSPSAGRDDLMPIAVLAPTGGDGAMAAAVLSRAGFTPVRCADMAELCARVGADVGALVIAEESLRGGAHAQLLGALAEQPSWSDVPTIVLTGDGELSEALSPVLETVTARANVTLLERPVRVATLVSALRSALRARRRQFDVRDYLEERAAAEHERERLLRLAEAERHEADAANGAKSEFLAMMSHELRTPLNAIAGYTELLTLGLRGPLTEAQQTDLARIRRSQEHLLGLINDVLNFARLEAGRAEFEFTSVRIADAVIDVLDLVFPQVNAKGLELESEACDPALLARADEEKLRQVLVNLISNAVKFTDAPGRIAVSCRRHDDRIDIQVRDTGIGIPEARLEHIFEPFIQVDPRLNRRRDGTGLGLAISRELARGMGGDLHVESIVGEGTVFTLCLPAADAGIDGADAEGGSRRQAVGGGRV